MTTTGRPFTTTSVQIIRIREGHILHSRDFADPRILEDVTVDLRPGSRRGSRTQGRAAGGCRRRRADRLLEAGLNGVAESWPRVMPLLAAHLRVVAYDRAGLGGSAPAPGLAIIDRQIDDLASVITGLAAGPCVLAGHSWGGILVQMLTVRRPDLAEGLVLVHPGHEEMEHGLPLPLQWGWRVMRARGATGLHN